MADSTLFEDTFSLTGLNAQKYDRVSRITGTSSSNEIFLTLDINTELYPCSVGDRVHLVLASTLSLDGSKDEEMKAGGKGWRDVGRGVGSLADMYEYVCHGKVYRFEEGDGETIKVFVSFGGLLLYMEGPYKKLTPLHIDYVYLLMKKS